MGFSDFWIVARALTAVQKVKIAETRLYLIIVQRCQQVLIMELDNFLWLSFIELYSYYKRLTL